MMAPKAQCAKGAGWHDILVARGGLRASGYAPRPQARTPSIVDEARRAPPAPREATARPANLASACHARAAPAPSRAAP
ncbi:hypothetical protein [Paraburkholderia acidisoli]|uniref:Uncharacterized protein n=1 Tax=Paraburkholderia acidisoli TaxID=2571748 RepID=A0A7Z2JJX1_9BURK|nr:hypothetical protein [Paraburkholderia acidisoli]QGZ65810.1 hypothetical protein FAZ98_28605 [Paraburkholderia acidisoli]